MQYAAWNNPPLKVRLCNTPLQHLEVAQFAGTVCGQFVKRIRSNHRMVRQPRCAVACLPPQRGRKRFEFFRAFHVISAHNHSFLPTPESVGVLSCSRSGAAKLNR